MAKKKKLPKAEYGQQMSSPGSSNFRNAYAAGSKRSPIFDQLALQYQLTNAAKNAGAKAVQDYYNAAYASAEAEKKKKEEESTSGTGTAASATNTGSTGAATTTQRRGGSVKSKKKK